MRQTVAQQQIVVLGASGATGRLAVSAALRRGHHVTALVRRPRTLPPDARLREVEWRDVRDAAPLPAALTGADAVISALGGAARGPTSVCTDAMATAVPAMRRAEVTRLVVVSAHGVAESRDRSLYARAVWAGVEERMRDKEAMERLVTASDLRWTVVRPPRLTDARPTGRYRVAADLPVHLWTSVGRADLADLLVREVEDPRHVHAFPRVAR
ncbi:NAD(P)-dependent oxidoreductase [Cellulomonas sp. NPDC057328]|uniref:NAD(P)-dependent oxidoreductase n=1 Tax=Cellulomonas sp. NPDC057328 TaxID=3346101 RepID=UPI00362E5BDB